MPEGNDENVEVTEYDDDQFVYCPVCARMVHWTQTFADEKKGCVTCQEIRESAKAEVC